MASTEAGQLLRRHCLDPLSSIDKSNKLHQNAGRAEILFLLVGAFPQETEPDAMRHYMQTVPTSTPCAERDLQQLTPAISSRSRQKYSSDVVVTALDFDPHSTPPHSSNFAARSGATGAASGNSRGTLDVDTAN